MTLDEIEDVLSRGANSKKIPEWVSDNAIEIFTEVITAEAKANRLLDEDTKKLNPTFPMESFVHVVGTLLALYVSGVQLVSCSSLALVDGAADPVTIQLLMGMPTTTATSDFKIVLLTPISVAMLRVLSGVAHGKRYRRPPSTVLLTSGVGTTNPQHSTATSATDDVPGALGCSPLPQ